MESRDPADDFNLIFPLPEGAVGVRTDAAGSALTLIEYLPAQAARAPDNALAREAEQQLRAWLADADFRFDLPLATAGTAFQRRVWAQISAVPRGATRTYGDLARELGSAARAVGQACGANPFPIVVPCHRVVAAQRAFNGGLGGFAHAREGWLIAIKHWLLRHERVLLA